MRICKFLAAITLATLCLEAALAANDCMYRYEPECKSSDCCDLLAQKKKFHAQASQDKFVYSLLYGLLGKQDPGYYLEIGAGDPLFINNSYFFEKYLQWNGTSIDISSKYLKKWYAARNNLLLIEDATKANYEAILQSFPTVVDYLSLDVDGYYTDVLEKIPFDKYTFKIITIEHDFYVFGDIYRSKEREMLSALGYHMLCADVMHVGRVFEDWWIHPSAFPDSVFSALVSLDLNGLEHSELMSRIHDIVCNVP